jgi:DNA repair exonuclease SbcCD ATPase subunit
VEKELAMRDARPVVALICFSMIIFLTACGGSYEESAEQAQDKAQAAAEDVEQAAEDLTATAEEAAEDVSGDIRATVDDLNQQIMAKEAKLKEITGRLEGLSATDLMADEAKSLKSESEALTQELATMKEKLQGYMDQLAE